MSKTTVNALELMEKYGVEDAYELEQAMRLDELKHYSTDELQAEIDSRAVTDTPELFPGTLAMLDAFSRPRLYGEDPRGDFSGATDGDR